MAWLLLIGASLLEVVWATALKHADGFSRFWPSAVGLIAAWASFILLAIALKGLPVGTAYAVWVGLGVLGVVLVGMIAMGEPAHPARLAFLLLIVVGVVGLRLVASD